MNKRACWDLVKNNPTFWPEALTDKEGQAFKWHTHADKPQSSQTFCVSAFGTLRAIEGKDHIVAQLLQQAWPQFNTEKLYKWTVELEREQCELLGEYGVKQPTSIDAFLTSDAEAIAVESKFHVDANEGFGSCSQCSGKNGNACSGIYGPGSDLKHPSNRAYCRLESWDGNRSPRLYWTLGRAYFQRRVYEIGQRCPFADSNYQLMRNFLYAAAYSQKYNKKWFGVVAICPEQRMQKLERQVEEFRQNVLTKEFSDRVILITYEKYIDLLYAAKIKTATQLADFLRERIAKIVI